MVGGDNLGIQQSQIAYSVVAELRTALLEAGLLSQTDDATMIPEITKPALRLCEGFLFAQDLAQQTSLNLEPISLPATVEDILNDLQPLAKLYNIDMEFRTTKPRLVAALSRQAFVHATHGLIYSTITALQNTRKPKLVIKTAYCGKPFLSVFSSDLDMVRKDLSRSAHLNKLRPTLMSCGIQSGFILADSLYRQMGSQLGFSANQYGKGFLAEFATTKQTALLLGSP